MEREQDSLEEWRETRAGLRKLYGWTRRHGWTWQAAGALSGLGGGIIFPVVGVLLSVAAWLRGDGAGGLSAHGAGNLLLLSTIPLLVSGAHCLDLLERRSERSRRPKALSGRSALVNVGRRQGLRADSAGH